jgi:O-antigen/teichoic acid export membrane protein
MEAVLSLKRKGLEIWSHEGFQKYFRNTGWMLGGRFFTLLISFTVGVYIARYLGPANYGRLSYVISFVGLFGFLATLGINEILNREIIKNPDQKNTLIGTAFYLKLSGGFLAILSVFIISFFITKDVFTLGLIWIYSTIFIVQSFGVIEIYFQSQVMSKRVVISQLCSNILATILKILVIVTNKGIFWLTLILVTEAILYSIFLLFSFKKMNFCIKELKFNFSTAKSILKDSWPLMLSAAAISIYMKIDQVMINNILGNEQTGIYAVAVKLSEVWYLIPMIICTSVFPSLIKNLNNKDIFEKRISKLYFSMFWLAAAIATFITIFSYPIIKILYGEAYIAAAVPLRIYVWAGLTYFLNIVVTKYFIANNFTRISFYFELIGLLINISLNIILIPKMGVAGAALTTLISYSSVFFLIFTLKRTRRHGLLILKSIFGY